MAPSRAPLKAGEYTILPLTIPGVPSYPQPATHYLYVRPHAPKVPDENTPRSLFASNLPIDATESSLRALFAQKLGGSRIERVDIEGARPKKSERGAAGSAKAGKKRKRGADTSAGEIGLPQTWDAELLSSGSGGVLVFVDKASAEMAMKEVIRAAKKRAEIVWKSDIALGLDSECPSFSLTQTRLTRCDCRISHPSRAYFPRERRPPGNGQWLSHPVLKHGSSSRQGPQTSTQRSR